MTSRAYVMSPATGACETQQQIDARRSELLALQSRAPLPEEDKWEVELRARKHAERMRLQQEADAQRELIRQSEQTARLNAKLREKESREVAAKLHFELSCSRWGCTPREKSLAEKLIRQSHAVTPEQIDAVVLKVKNAGLGERPQGSLW